MNQNAPKRKLPLDFELEKRLTHAAERQKIQTHVDERISTLKSHVRKGAQEEDFKKLGTLLRGYEALEKVIRHSAQGV